jgi:hypothetical protein
LVSFATTPRPVQAFKRAEEPSGSSTDNYSNTGQVTNQLFCFQPHGDLVTNLLSTDVTLQNLPKGIRFLGKGAAMKKPKKLKSKNVVPPFWQSAITLYPVMVR